MKTDPSHLSKTLGQFMEDWEKIFFCTLILCSPPRRYNSIGKIRSFILQNTSFTLFQKASEKNKVLISAEIPEGDWWPPKGRCSGKLRSKFDLPRPGLMG
jgi:hypothetical protein